ncbi:MAG: Flp pilus assembly complex ATPase component TadA [Phycisphaeraceae bacterium]|nr:Flp pilus assembly complex ATPase component TadA [Phycisphaerales bacterium]MCB9861560.1 Flp pilus assembly complex ATPase component TadA [Phycisphaeraceae bacterium]
MANAIMERKRRLRLQKVAALYLKPKDFQGKLVPLGTEPITIGRHPENALRVPDDRASRYHCVIEPDGSGGVVLRDLSSRNGTKVNNIKVDRVLLSAGDVVKVGVHEWIVFGGYESSGLEDFDDVLDITKIKPTKFDAALQWELAMTDLAATLAPRGQLEKPLQLIDASGKQSDGLFGRAIGPRALTLLLQTASKSHATDIHIEPKMDDVQVRMRVDGMMVPIVDLPKQVASLVLGMVKAACHVNETARDAVIDGHFSVTFPDRRVEYRASFTPSVHGQKLVLRVLDRRDSPSSLDEIGIPPFMRQRLRDVCESDQGLLLCCGPTGSGKTTTLYNALREIDRSRRNVVTIEDPVEYQIEGVTQMPIDEHRGNSFHSLLRSVLRQDPDVILVGEIRDEETARTAMRAAMTGHVVFSTVHAKDTITSVFRLLDLNVEPFLVANALDIVLAQRLVRVLCDNCKREIPYTAGESSRMGRFTKGKGSHFIATGCPNCLRTGYRGRRALYEMLDVTDDLRDVILNQPSIAALRKVIETGVFHSLQQSGWSMMADGITTLEEVNRVTGQS